MLVFVLRKRCCRKYLYFGNRKQQEDRKMQCIVFTVQQRVRLKEHRVDKSEEK